METREIHIGTWQNILCGICGILFGGAMVYAGHGDLSDWRSRCLMLVFGWLFLVAGAILVATVLWRRVARKPYLRLTDEALEVYVGSGRGYEHYPWRQIRGWRPGVVQGRTYLVLDMDRRFCPVAIDPLSLSSGLMARVLGSPYTIRCGLTLYGYDRMAGILYAHWKEFHKKKA